MGLFVVTQCNGPRIVCNMTLELSRDDRDGIFDNNNASLPHTSRAYSGGENLNYAKQDFVRGVLDKYANESCYGPYIAQFPVKFDPHDGRPHVYTGYCAVSYMAIPSAFYRSELFLSPLLFLL